MAIETKRIEVVAAVINRDGKFLVAQRSTGDKSVQGLWEFPGGKIEPGESPIECLKRELKEELNIEADIGELLLKNNHDYNFAKIKLITYRAEYLSGDFILSDHSQIKWLELAEFDQYEFVSADYRIIEHLRSQDDRD